MRTVRLRLFIITVIFSIAATVLAEENKLPANLPIWSDKPELSEIFSNEIRELTVYLIQQEIQMERLARFSIAYPRSSKEYNDMDGFAVMKLIVLTQVREEVPPNKVYLRVDGENITLQKVVSSIVEEEIDEVIGSYIGKYRWNSLYLVPIYLIKDTTELKIDFAINRKEFIVRIFGKDSEEKYEKVVSEKPIRKWPEIKSMINIIKREFPGFLVRK